MKGKLFLVAWDAALVYRRVGALQDAGWVVAVETQDHAQAYRAIRSEQPDVVVVDLASRPADGQMLVRHLRLGKATRDLPVIFLDGDEDARLHTRDLLPGAIFCAENALPGLLEQFIS